MSGLSKLHRYVCNFVVGIILLQSCGPPLTDPSSTDIGGHWATTIRIGPLQAVQMNITQGSDGTVSGQWSANVSLPLPACPPQLNSHPVGSVSGTNTVLEVRLSFLGAGDFAGQAINDHTLKGSFISCSHIYPITFSRVAPLAAP